MRKNSFAGKTIMAKNETDREQILANIAFWHNGDLSQKEW
jgi:hypothetical protein